MKYSIGVDMGGTNTDLGLVTENGNIVQRRNLPTNAYTQFEPYIKDMMKVVDEMLEAQRTIDVALATHFDDACRMAYAYRRLYHRLSCILQASLLCSHALGTKHTG